MAANSSSASMKARVSNNNAQRDSSTTKLHADANAVRRVSPTISSSSSHPFRLELGPLENPCASQPCRNGGQCTVTDASSFECQCAPGYDGKTCELDARACQTLQPCGQSQDSKCQSFRAGAALSHICILQDGLAYGLSAQQGNGHGNH